MNPGAQQIFRPEFAFGLGGVSLGNEFDKHTHAEADQALEAAWAIGVRRFDVAPWHGLGLSERRFGHFLQFRAARRRRDPRLGRRREHAHGESEGDRGCRSRRVPVCAPVLAADAPVPKPAA
jgi:hypothetical protein